MPYIPSLAVNTWGTPIRRRMTRKQSYRFVRRLRVLLWRCVRAMLVESERRAPPPLLLPDRPSDSPATVTKGCGCKSLGLLLWCTGCHTAFRRPPGETWRYHMIGNRMFHFCERCWPLHNTDAARVLRNRGKCERVLNARNN